MRRLGKYRKRSTNQQGMGMQGGPQHGTSAIEMATTCSRHRSFILLMCRWVCLPEPGRSRLLNTHSVNHIPALTEVYPFFLCRCRRGEGICLACCLNIHPCALILTEGHGLCSRAASEEDRVVRKRGRLPFAVGKVLDLAGGIKSCCRSATCA